MKKLPLRLSRLGAEIKLIRAVLPKGYFIGRIYGKDDHTIFHRNVISRNPLVVAKINIINETITVREKCYANKLRQIAEDLGYDIK